MISGKKAVAIALTMIIAVPIILGYAFASEEVTRSQLTVDYTKSVTETLLNDDAYYYTDYNGPQNNGRLMYGYSFAAPDYAFVSSIETSTPVGISSSHVVALTPGSYVSLSGYTYDWSSSLSGSANVRVTYLDGTTDTVTYIGGEFVKVGSVFMAKDGGFSPTDVYTLISDVEINPVSDNSMTLSYYSSSTTQFADPAFGWSTPAASGYDWVNGYANGAVTFYLHLDASSTVTFEPHNGVYSSGDYDVQIASSSAGLVTVTSPAGTAYSLGKYTDMQIVYDLYKGSCTVSGIVGWPSMGAIPTPYSSVTFDVSSSWAPDGYFTMLALEGDEDALWRFDVASIVSGTFPATIDYTLKMSELFPGTDYNLKLNSIGIYGGSIKIAGITYPVTDGAITVDGHDVRLKGAVIQVVREAPYWIVTVNGINAAQAQTAPTVVFDDTWSLTATAEILKTETVTTEEWVPGVFAFDKDSFILMIIFCAAAAFVVLGFTAGRSGGKVLLLAVACGGASVIALMLV